MPVSKKTVDPMDKAIPRNPRYADIGPTLDTGASISKLTKKMEEFCEDFKIRNDEIFKRMKLSTFIQLLVQISEMKEQARRVQQFDEPAYEASQSKCEGDGEPSEEQPILATHSKLENLVGGLGEVDVYLRAQQQSKVGKCNNDKLNVDDGPSAEPPPYLLLDLRDREEFDACHIITARNYPIAMLSRSVNYETPEMLAYRNKPGYIIVLYDEDERISPRAAATLVQRGYMNLYLLSGGLRYAWKRFPEGLIIGKMPTTIRQTLRVRHTQRPSRNTVGDRLNSINSSCNSRNSSNSTVNFSSTASVAESTSSRTTNRSSGQSTPTIYCEPGSRDKSNGLEEFLPEDIVNLSMCMEKALENGRSVRSGYARSNVTVSSTRTSEFGGRKPFRC